MAPISLSAPSIFSTMKSTLVSQLEVILLQISTWKWDFDPVSMALMLVPVDTSPDTFRGVGIAEVPNVDGLGDDGWETKDFCII